MSFKLLEIGRDALRRVRIGRAALVAAAACVATAPTPSFAQTIDGDHTISADTKLTEDVTVNGQLILDGAAVDLNGHKLTVKGGWSVSGEAGADGADIVQNGSFETGFSTGSYAGWSDTSHPDSWTMTRGGVGCSRNGQPWIGVGVPNGTYVAYLQMGGTIEQTLTVPESGFYTMSFKYAARRDSGYAGGLVNVMFDNKVCFVDEFTRSATAVRTGTATVWLDAGSTVLQIRHAPSRLDASNDQSMWVDSVKVVKADVAPGIYGMATGAPGELRIETANAADVAAALPAISGNAKVVYALTDDADWTAAGAINIPSGATLDLCGHTLAVAGLTGGGIVTDSANGYYTVQRDAAGNVYLQTKYLKATQSGVGSNSASNMQCIDTGYSHNKDTEVDLRVSWQSTTFNTWSVAYGGRNTSGDNRKLQLGVWVHNGFIQKNACATADVADTSTKPTLDAYYDVHISKSGQNTAQAVGSETVIDLATGNGLNDNKNGTDFMFSNNQFNNTHHGFWPCKCTITYCRITEAGVTMRDFVPAKRLSDGEYGMFDTVRQEFLTRINSTSVPFESGGYTVNAEAAAFGSSGVLRIAVPAGTTLALDDMPKIVGDVKILKEGAGTLVYNEATSSQKYFLGGYEDHSAPLTAVWTGAANNNDFADAANWSCTNDLGSALSGVAPDATTIKYVLTADADWTAKGAIALGTGMTLDLNGHNLTATSITGAGVVTDTTAADIIVADDGSMYQKIKYVQATQEGANNSGNGQTDGRPRIQYVDTEYRHVGTTRVDIRVEFQDVSYSGNYGYAVFYGCRNSGSDTAYQLGGWIHSNKFYYYDTGEHDGSTAKTDVIYDVRLDKNGSSYANYEDGTRASGLGTGNGAGESNTYGTDYIFANNQVQSGGKYWPCKCRVYSCKVYEGSEPKRDFVPVRCISGAKAGQAGFWCNVTEKFYGNSGYGSLTAGPVVQSETSGGEFHITVAENTTLSLGALTSIYGGIKVVKEGAGAMTLPVDGQYFTGGFEVAGGTLPMTQTAAFLAGTPITATAGGTITIAASDGASYTNDFKLAGGTLKVLASGTGNTTTAAIAGTLALETGAADAQPVVSIDMTDCTSATFQLNTTALNVGSGVTAAPGFVSLADTTAYEASIVDGTAIKVEHLTSPVTAVWTGLGEAGNFNDPDNWSCSNKYGVALANTLPDNTTLTFRLGTDADWTAKGAIALGEGVKLDLNGRTLAVSDITGSGVVTDSSAPGNSALKDANGNLYAQLEYLASSTTYSGNTYNWGSAYIDTGYEHNTKTVVDMKVAITDTTSNWYCYYGSRKDWGATQIGGWIHSTSRYHYIYRSENGSEQDLNGANGKPKLQYTVNVPFLAHFEAVGPCTIDGTQTTVANGGSSDTTDWLFGVNHKGMGIGASYMAKAKIYYCTVKEKTETAGVYVMQRDFVAAQRLSDGVLGMLDKENGVFYTNNGSGSFVAGPPKASDGTTAAGELHITVAENATLSLANTAKIAGNVKIVKDGLGTLVAPTTGHYFVGGIDVTAGTLSMGGALAYGGTINAASGTTVSVPASVGSAGTSVVNSACGTLAVASCGTSLVDGTVTLGGNAISVAGSFAPVSGTAAHTITLADGATLDFTQWTGAFPVAHPTLAYASGANITLKLEPASTGITDLAKSKDAETGKPNGYLLSWDAIPTGVTFRPDAATGARFRIVPDENGLLMSFVRGFSIIIR